MKKFILLSFIVFYPFFSIAQITTNQNNNEVELQKKYMKIRTNKPSIITFGLGGFGYFPIGVDKDVIGNGGGIDIKFKVNLNRYIGFQTNFLYSHSKISKNASDGYYTLNVASNSNIFDIREAIVIQRETRKGENGFVPWLALGVGFSIHSANGQVYENYYSGGYFTESSITEGYTGFGFNIFVGLGFRYNFKKFYLGANAEYSYTLTSEPNVSYYNYYYGVYTTSYGANMDASGFKVGVEVGFRI